MDRIMCHACGRLYDPRLHHRCWEPRPSAPIVHLLLGAGIGFGVWRLSESALAAIVAGLMAAWFFRTRIGRLLALVAVLGSTVYLVLVLQGR